MRGVVCVCPLVASTCQRITSFYRLTTVEVGTEPESSLYKLTSYTIGKIIFSAFQWYNLSIFISWAKKVIKQNVKLSRHFLIIHYGKKCTEPGSSLYKLTSYTIGKIIFSAFQLYNLPIFISWAKKVI